MSNSQVLRPTGAKFEWSRILGPSARKRHQGRRGAEDLTGVTSIAYTEGDPRRIGKGVAKYVKDKPEFSSRQAW